MKAALLTNVAQSESPSMARYANELLDALYKLQADDWEFEKVRCNHVETVANLIPGPAGKLAAERLARFIKYPLTATMVRASIYHIVDSGHANIGIGLDPKKTVVTVHDLIAMMAHQGIVNMPAPALHSLTNPIRTNVLKRASHIISVSHNTKKDIVSLLQIPAERISVVHHGFSNVFRAPSEEELTLARQELRSRHSIPEHAKLILHVSGGAEYKNTSAVLHGLAVANRELANYGKSAMLVRAGSDLSPSEKTLAINLGINDKIVLAGYLQGDEELRNHYWAADVFAFPSLWEGFGWPVLESMACGTPVVTSNAASLPEVAGNAGILVGPYEHEQLGLALARLVTEQKLRTELRAAGFAQAAQFSWTKAARGTLDVYEMVASHHKVG